MFFYEAVLYLVDEKVDKSVTRLNELVIRMEPGVGCIADTRSKL